MSYKLQPDVIVSIAQTEICKKIPEMVAKNEATIIAGIVNNMAEIIKGKYETIIEKGMTDIQNNFSTELKPKFIDTIVKMTKQLTSTAITEQINNLTKTSKGGNKRKSRKHKRKSKRTQKRR